MIENIKTYNILISGRVQGVGFRYFAVSVAEKYDVRGYVTNKRDGKVEIVCQGEEEELQSFMEEVKKGPAFSVVTDTVMEEIPEEKKYNTFDIKY
jgi:acylphosphatase